MILLDPKDVLTRQLPTLARAMGLEDRTVLIDPLLAPVSLNLFDKGDGSPGAIHNTISRLIRVMNTITLDLQPFQRDTLALAIEALFALSDTPSFEQLFPILRDGKKGIDLDLLPADLRDVFEHDYRDNEGRYVVSRLNTFRRNPYFKPLVMGTAPPFDLLAKIQEGNLILIKAGTSEPLYGKIWIEQIDRIIDQRFDIPEEDRTETFVIIDEAQIFIGDPHSEHFADILDRAREAKISMFVACQHMDQIKSAHVRASLYNSALKFIAKTNADLHDLSRSMVGEVDANTFRNIPLHHFLFCSPDSEDSELIKVPEIKYPRWKWEDVRYFHKRAAPQPEKATYTPPPTQPLPQEETPAVPTTPQRKKFK